MVRVWLLSLLPLPVCVVNQEIAQATQTGSATARTTQDSKVKKKLLRMAKCVFPTHSPTHQPLETSAKQPFHFPSLGRPSGLTEVLHYSCKGWSSGMNLS